MAGERAPRLRVQFGTFFPKHLQLCSHSGVLLRWSRTADHLGYIIPVPIYARNGVNDGAFYPVIAIEKAGHCDCSGGHLHNAFVVSQQLVFLIGRDLESRHPNNRHTVDKAGDASVQARRDHER